MDLFYDNDGTGANTYLGKYNFNNEKSESAIIYGFEGIEGFNDEASLNGQRNKCICLEFLNNSEALCLFGTTDMSSFDDALEFRLQGGTLPGGCTRGRQGGSYKALELDRFM